VILQQRSSRFLTRGTTSAWLLLWCCCAQAIAQEPEVIVEVDRQQVYQGESLIYNVTLNHVENPSEPTLNGFDQFRVELLGQQSLDSRQISIINGRRSEVVRRGMLFQYRLTPTTAGRIQIPAPTAVVAGDTITGRTIPIEVIAPEEQDIVLLETSVDKRSVYPLQPFTITLMVAVRQLPGQLSDRSPLSIQSRQPVNLSVPWLQDENIPDGLEAKQTWRQILEPLVSGSSRRSSDGFAINNIESQSAFSLFEGSRKTLFLPSSKRTTRPGLDGESKGYVEYTLQRTFIPQRLGEYHFAAASVKGTFGTEISKEGLSGDQVYAVSKEIDITVKDVPQDGRPEFYGGAIGTFEMSASMVPVTARLGDPMTLTVTIHGEGTVADIRPPQVANLPGISENFRTYEATEKTVRNGRTFTFSLRPLSKQVAEFPAIPFAYFDVNQEKYVSLQTDPIPLTITDAKQLATSDIVAPTGDTSNDVSGNTLELNDAGLFANHSSLQTLKGTHVVIKRWMTTWIVMIAGYLGLSFGIQRHQRLHSDPRLLRRRNARSRAIESLKAVTTAAGEPQKVSADALSRIVAGLIADYTGESEAGMTSAEAMAALQQQNADPTVSQRVAEFLADCDAARFGAGASDAESLTRECEALIEIISGKGCFR